MAGAKSQPRQSCQFLFLLDEKPAVVLLGSAGERSGGAQEVPYGGLRWQSVLPPQIVWNRSNRLARARGGAWVGRPRWLRILTITGGSSISAMIFQGAAA